MSWVQFFSTPFLRHRDRAVHGAREVNVRVLDCVLKEADSHARSRPEGGVRILHLGRHVFISSLSRQPQRGGRETGNLAVTLGLRRLGSGLRGQVQGCFHECGPSFRHRPVQCRQMPATQAGWLGWRAESK